MQGGIPEPYAAVAQNVFAGWAQAAAVTRPLDVAEAVWRAANDASCPLRIAAGADAVALAESGATIELRRWSGIARA